MKKFKFKHLVNSEHLDTVEGRIKVDSASNTAEISDTLAAILGANNFGEIIQDLGEDVPVSGDASDSAEGDESSTPTPTAEDVLKELLRKTVDQLKAIGSEYGLSEEEMAAQPNKMALAKFLMEKAFNAQPTAA